MTYPPEGDCRGGLSLAHVRLRGRSRFDMTQPCSCRIRRRRLIPAEPEFRTVEPRPEKYHGHARGQRCRGALPAPLCSQAERPGLGQFICLVPFSITVVVWQNAVCSAVLRVHVLSPDSSRSPDWLRDGASPAQPVRRATNVEVPDSRNRRCLPQDGSHRWHDVSARPVR